MEIFKIINLFADYAMLSIIHNWLNVFTSIFLNMRNCAIYLTDTKV